MTNNRADPLAKAVAEPSAPWVSVVVCTRDRQAMLSGLLDSMLRLEIPNHLCWELIVVDNGRTDGTAAVVSQYAGRLPVRRVQEPMPGLSNARNRGVLEARGRYICWTDDDVVVDPTWLAAYLDAFARHPEAAIFGGGVTPQIEPPTPSWFTRCSPFWPLTSITAFRDSGEDIAPITGGGPIPWGANFALRALEQRRFAYDPALGASPLHRRVGEETDLIQRIMAAGGTGWWVPACKVRHRIPPGRQTLAYILDYFRSVGETAAYQHLGGGVTARSGIPDAPPFVLAGPVQLWIRAALALQLFVSGWLFGRTCFALRQWAQLGRCLGVLAYRRGTRARSSLGETGRCSSEHRSTESHR